MPSLPSDPHPRPHPIGWGWEIPPIIAKLWMQKVKNLFNHACGNILVGRHTKPFGPNCGKVELLNFAHIYNAQQHSFGVQLWQGETAWFKSI